jgi:hypothetical protein
MKMAKMTPLEKAAMEKQVAEERKKGIKSGASDRVLSAGKEALDEQRRETRGKSPDIESRAKTAYKDPYTITEDKQSESSKQEQENEAKDRKAKAEYDNYMKGEKTRLKDQGSSFFKKGGKVSSASKRADGCATKGKTKGKML